MLPPTIINIVPKWDLKTLGEGIHAISKGNTPATRVGKARNDSIARNIIFCVERLRHWRHGPRRPRERGGSALLFIMSPHADDLYNFLIFNNLVNQPMLNIYTS